MQTRVSLKKPKRLGVRAYVAKTKATKAAEALVTTIETVIIDGDFVLIAPKKPQAKGAYAFNRVPAESDSISTLPPNSLSLSRIPAIPTPTSDPLPFIFASLSAEIPLP